MLLSGLSTRHGGIGIKVLLFSFGGGQNNLEYQFGMEPNFLSNGIRVGCRPIPNPND